MKKLLFILSFLVLSMVGYSQTFIEMMSPEDADVVLMEVADSVDADIIIYITKDKEESSQWKCMWRFKNWGFSNFSIFIASDTTQLIMSSEDAFEEEEYMVEIDGTIYFTNDPAEARYRDPYFRLPGVMRIIKYKE